MAANDMARTAETVNMMTMQTDASMQEASRTVIQLSQLATQLRELVARFKL